MSATLGIRVPLTQGSPAWLAWRREHVTATGIGAILGLDPQKSEAGYAAELDGAEPARNIAMRRGTVLEPLAAQLHAERTGRPLRRGGVWEHRALRWAGASLDYTRDGVICEIKTTSSWTRFADGVPREVEAQVVWQMGVSGRRAAEVVVLQGDELLDPMPVEWQPDVFADLCDAAADFLRRRAAGGPFAQTTGDLSRRQDDGSELAATEADALLAQRLHEARTVERQAKAAAEAIADQIKARIGEHSALAGDGWRITWKRAKDSEQVHWEHLAGDLLDRLPEPERAALVRSHSVVREGARYLRVAFGKDGD